MENGKKLKIFTGNSSKPLSQEICEYLDVPLGDATVTSFPDMRALSVIMKILEGWMYF